MSTKTLAIVQANYTDLLPGDRHADHYVIARLQQCRRVDRIVIAAPDNAANRARGESGLVEKYVGMFTFSAARSTRVISGGVQPSSWTRHPWPAITPPEGWT